MIKTAGEHRRQIPSEVGECQGKRELQIFFVPGREELD